VDQSDFAVFQVCYDPVINPAEFAGLPLACRCMDKLSPAPNKNIGADDYDRFEACASGPGIPANPACDD
jgi:hypothetical protein